MLMVRRNEWHYSIPVPYFCAAFDFWAVDCCDVGRKRWGLFLTKTKHDRSARVLKNMHIKFPFVGTVLRPILLQKAEKQRKQKH